MFEEVLVNVNSRGAIESIEDSLDAASQILEKTNGLTGDQIATQLNFLLGEILTIVDASIQEHVQRKAVKDLVKSKFYSRLDWIVQLSTGKFGNAGQVGEKA